MINLSNIQKHSSETRWIQNPFLQLSRYENGNNNNNSIFFFFYFLRGETSIRYENNPTIIIPFHFFGGGTSLSHGRDDLQRSDFDIRIICRILVSCKISVSCNNLSDYLFLQNSAFSKSKSGKVWLFLLNILSLDLTDQDWLMKDKEYLYRPGGRSLNIFHYNIR